MSQSFTYEIVDCPECGAKVADNWLIKHLKSGCKIGINIVGRSESAWKGLSNAKRNN